MSWFENWFDSPFYPILYSDRNEEEAQKFIDNLIREIPLQTPGPLLDLACGRGRHSKYLAEQGFEVTGVDLSEKSIEYAQQFSHSNLQFIQGDMRTFNANKCFEYILNLFTSFGYFDSEEEDIQVFKNVHSQLNTSGWLIQDYLNAHWVEDTLVSEELKSKEGIEFYITREVRDKKVIKTIQFVYEGKTYQFHEKVKLYTLKDFEYLAHKSGFVIRDTFGDYALNAFDEKRSKRLILKYKKI